MNDRSRAGRARTRRAPACLLACLVLAGVAAAQDSVYVPDALEPWRAWVLDGHEHRACPFFFDRDPADAGHAVCAWPSVLELAVDEGRARFTQAWTVYATAQWVPLPGDANRWPEAVTDDGRPAGVAERDGRPAVWLPPGRHVLSGTFAWAERPRTLAVPPATGIIALTIDGRRIDRPERTGNSLWLGEREAAPRTADALDVRVHRLVEDGVPTRLYTRFTVDVAGRQREVVIEPALPAGFIPTALAGGLPARLEGDGRLRLQVRPGTFEVRLDARAADVLNEIPVPRPVSHLPGTEIWSYRGNDRLRVATPEGLAPVDPEQVDVPPELGTLPAFRAEAGQVLTLVEQSRGRAGGGDRLELARVLWRDFDGSGFTFGDRLTGRLDDHWRLDMALPYRLGSAAEHGDNLLVTAGPGEGLTGVELRTQELMLEAFGRLEARGAVPASGWQARLDGLRTELYLPPGEKLLAAAGADRAPGAWVERWRLLDFFLVLIVTLAAARLFGRPAGAVALVALVLSWHEPGAPHWAWLNALAAFALARVAPPGRLQRAVLAYRALSVAGLVVLLVPFLAGQLRVAIHPQLERQAERAVGPSDAAVKAHALAPAPAPAAAGRAARLEATQAEAAVPVMMRDSGPRYARYAPNAVVQAGPGRPTWRWSRYDLTWSGPVDAERTLRLWILPRWLVSTLRVAAVLLVGAFVASFALEMLGRRRRDLFGARPGGGSGHPGVTAAVTLALALGLAVPPRAVADMPPPELLQELGQRLLEPPPCTPRCAEIVAAVIAVTPEALSITLEVHAYADVAVPLPGSAAGWRPERVAIDGTATPPVYQRADGTWWIRAPGGRHRVELSGPLPPVAGLDLPFPAVPRVVDARAEGWTLAGVEDRRLRAGSLTLTRVRGDADGDAGARWESSRFPVFVRVERTVELDLEWRVSTTVRRVAPEQGAITLEIPLLPGASLLTADLPVVDGRVRVAFGPSDEVVTWTAALPRVSPLVLEAPADAPWTEVWRFGVGNVWHATFDGIPESQPRATGGARIAEFHPRGGESLVVEATRPDAVAGATLAFDAVALTTEIGARSRTSTLELGYRSTRGAQHPIRLPEDARLLDVTIDGRQEPLRLAAGGELGLPILPGEHRVRVRWQQDAAAGTRVRTPDVDLGAAAGNVALDLELPPDRWVLATSGPRLGPAVMYWPELAAMLLVAWLLGRTSLTPLTTRHWLLLSLGFSTFAWPALFLVIAWLLATGGRARLRLADDVPRWRFNLLQVALAVLALAALAAILGSVPSGLLGAPDMHVVGNGSSGHHLRWFADRAAGPLPGASALSLPLWAYKALILAWALWLSFALLRWLPWAWRAFSAGGLWRARARTAPV